MNRYLIHKKIRTPISLFERVECLGYMIDWYGKPFDGSEEALVITKEITGDNYREAFSTFISGLIPIVNIMSVVTQCITESFSATSHIIYKINNNPERIAFFYYAGERDVVGMNVGANEIADIETILAKWTEEERTAFTYLREANCAFTPTARLAMLVIAAEAFAGESTMNGACKSCGAAYSYPSVNKEAICKILGEELQRYVYVKSRLRHKLFHGGPTDEMEIVKVGDEMYKRIVLGYVVERYGLKAVHEIKNAPRSFSYECFGTFTKIEKVGAVSLKQLEDNHATLQCVEKPENY